MAGALGDAHLVIARAGASTVAELAAAGRPAIFAPYPHATDDHQSANARSVIEAGGGWLVPDRDFTPDRLRHLVEACLAEPERLVRAAERARQFGKPDAADALADFVLSEVREAEA